MCLIIPPPRLRSAPPLNQRRRSTSANTPNVPTCGNTPYRRTAGDVGPYKNRGPPTCGALCSHSPRLPPGGSSRHGRVREHAQQRQSSYQKTSRVMQNKNFKVPQAPTTAKAVPLPLGGRLTYVTRAGRRGRRPLRDSGSPTCGAPCLHAPKKAFPGGLGAEARPVGDEAPATREKIRSIGYGSVQDDYIFEWGFAFPLCLRQIHPSCVYGSLWVFRSLRRAI